MPKNKSSLKPFKPYKIKIFYARSYEVEFHTELDARRHLQAKALTSKATHYSELWKMKNEYDGEQLAVYENSAHEMILK